MQSQMNLFAFRGRRGVHVLGISAGMWLGVLSFLSGCSEVTLTPGDGGSTSTGSTTTGTSQTVTSGTTSGSGAPMTACEQYCNTDPACGQPSPDCVQTCEMGTADACKAQWDPYSACLGKHFDATTCKYQFHACEAEAIAVSKCLGTSVCYTDCDATAGGCDCTHACVGDDWTWDCQKKGSQYECDCTHAGGAVGSCTGDAAGSCETGALVVFCCLQL